MAARILVVERNPKIGGLIAGQLREKGSEAVEVSTALKPPSSSARKLLT